MIGITYVQWPNIPVINASANAKQQPHDLRSELSHRGRGNIKSCPLMPLRGALKKFVRANFFIKGGLNAQGYQKRGF